MAVKDSDKKQWPDPKDYGLPFVEITPLRSKSNPESKAENPTVPPPVIDPVVIAEKPVIPEVKAEANQPKQLAKTEAKTEIPNPVSHSKVENKKTPSWVWVSIVLAVGLISFIIWQLQSQNENPSEVSQPTVAENSLVEEPLATPSNVTESTATDQNQTVVNQDSIPVINNSNPNISKPAETGTTIANIASGNLIRIESKAERPQYFIVVGSLPNEKLAIEEASQYFSKSAEIYLISPEEGSRNYRLALSKFGSFRLAAEELERIKSQYTEELWILKY